MPDPWPLWGLELRTPRLTLRPDDDAGLLELLAEACRGVHPPAEMPFDVPWTDAEPETLVLEGIKYHWSARVASRPDDWQVNFLARYEGRVIGNQGVSARDFAITRNVNTGSWLGLSMAFDDNTRSHGASRHLGYQPNGTETQARRGKPATKVRLVLTRDRFRRPTWQLKVTGLQPALPMSGL